MSPLKSFALTLLNFLLFLSLSVFGLAFMLNTTLLNPDFVVSELNKIDVPLMTGELVNLETAQQQDVEFAAEALDATVVELEPWIKEQVSDVVFSGYDYLLGRSQHLNVIIPMEPVVDSLKSNLKESLLASPPPELAGASPAAIDQYLSGYYRQISEDIPPTLEVTESSLSPDVLVMLEMVKQYIRYFQIGYPALIAFMVILVLGIILISRNLKNTTRSLGITLLFYGVLEYASIVLTRRFVLPQVPLGEIPTSLEAWLLEVTSDILAPLEIFSIGVMAAGVILLVFFFVYKARQPDTEPSIT